ncbi:hypothetical protein CsSME_00040001 [Camellia sinensis var. sinensis]
MERQLEITIVWAKGLKDVGHFSKMDVYVSVAISGNPCTHQKTPVDKDGGSTPSWNYPRKFTIDEGAIQMNGLNLIFMLRHERTLLGDKDVGEVHVPVKGLLNNAGDSKSPVSAEYPVRKPSGNQRRTKVCLQIRSGYPTPASSGYKYPLPAGYRPMAQGYGYPPMQQPQQAPTNNRFRLGAGLVGGLIGGMLIGEMASDAAGYHGWYGDGGDF